MRAQEQERTTYGEGRTQTPLDAAQEAVNLRHWTRHDHVETCAIRTLRPVEVTILVRHRDALRGRVLEIGCGAGRLTGYLAQLARSLEATDISEAMVAACARAHPDVSVRRQDIRDVQRRAPESVDAIVAPFNVIDVLTDSDRRRALDGMHRALSADGLLIMSSHNRAAASTIRPPTQLRFGDPLRLAADLVRLPRRAARHRRLKRFEHVERDYAVYNDSAHDYALLHYYISPAVQARQLADHGFELIECLDLDGRTVEVGGEAPGSPELHYVARRVAENRDLTGRAPPAAAAAPDRSGPRPS
jgi:SAM-dependent methyltransferase